MKEFFHRKLERNAIGFVLAIVRFAAMDDLADAAQRRRRLPSRHQVGVAHLEVATVAPELLHDAAVERT